MHIVLLLSSNELKINIIKQLKECYLNCTIYDLSFSYINDLPLLLDKIHTNIIIIDDAYVNDFGPTIYQQINSLSQNTHALRIGNDSFNSLISIINKSKDIIPNNYISLSSKKKCCSHISPKTLLFVYKNNYYKVVENDVFYFEMQNKYLQLRLSDRKINVGRITLKNIKSYLNSSLFCYCNQSFLINLNKVKSIENNSHGLIVTFDHIHDHVYITNKYKQQLIKKFTNVTHNIIRFNC